MDAVQAMAGNGGWPLNVFLTPDAKPFYGGTYFPPVRAHNRLSWKEVLEGIRYNYEENRSQVEEQARTVTEHLAKSNQFGIKPHQYPDSFRRKIYPHPAGFGF